MKRSIHIEAPAEKVFDLLKDPRYLPEGARVDFEVTDVNLTDNGVGTYYSWVTKTPALRIEGFNVYTEFVPNQRITDRCSWPFIGDMTISFEPEGSGMKLTLEAHPRSFWRIPPLRELTDLFKIRSGERLLSAVKADMEAQGPGMPLGALPPSTKTE